MVNIKSVDSINKGIEENKPEIVANKKIENKSSKFDDPIPVIIEKEKIECPFCFNEYSNLKRHLKICKDNPANKIETPRSSERSIYLKYLKQYVHKITLPNEDYEFALDFVGREEFINQHIKMCKNRKCYWKRLKELEDKNE